MKNYILNTLFKPVSASVISTFRIFFGSLLFLEMLYFWRIGFVPYGLVRPVFHLKYDYFEWVEPLSELAMNGILLSMTVSAVLIAIGFLYRIATAIFLFGFTYFMLIEQSHYNNHFYLFILILFLMLFVDADRMYSIKSWRKKNDSKVPAWHHLIFTFLLFITYFYGGIAKLSSEWISGRVARALVDNLPNSNTMKSALGAEGFATFLQYGGILFDLGIGFLLLFKKTRWFAFIGVIIFNYTNGVILFDDIGYFPIFMVLATILFFESDFVEKLFNKKEKKINYSKKKKTVVSNVSPIVSDINWTKKRIITAGLIGGFVLIQLLLPFRHHLYSGNPEWDGRASRFSWRMKMQVKTVEKLELKMKNLISGEELLLPVKQHLTGHQAFQILFDPNNVAQLAQHFYRQASDDNKIDMTSIVVRGDVIVKFNGREEQMYINPQIDLAKIDPRENKIDWILPLKKIKKE